MHKKVAKTKVLYIITKSNFGGAQRYVYDMATNITRSGYEAVVALGENQNNKTVKHRVFDSLKEKLKDAGVRTITIPYLTRDVNIFSEWKVFFSLLKILKQEKPNVVHLNSSKIGGLGAFAVRIHNILPQGKILKTNKLMKLTKLKARIIFTAHGWAYKEDRNLISKKVIYFLSWLTIILSHKIITVSYDDFNNAPKLFAKEKIKMIHNGISEIKFKDKATAQKTITARLNLTVRNTIWIGTISELHNNKGLTFVIKAIHKLIKRGYKILFFIIGEGEERFQLEKFIKKLGLEENIFLLGHVNNASELLKAFDIFTLTSIKEGLPYVLLEAGLASLPVVATNVGGSPDVIKNRKSGRLVRPKNSHDIENAISDLIDFKKDALQYGNVLKEKVEQDFTIEQMVAETIDLYS